MPAAPNGPFSDEAARERLHNNLTNHPPVDEQVIDMFESLRSVAKVFGDMIIEYCPSSPERSTALSYLEESVMRAVQSIAVHQEEALAKLLAT